MKLIETITISSLTGLVENGIFTLIGETFDENKTPFEEWLVEYKDELDNEYYLNHSGQKSLKSIYTSLFGSGQSIIPSIIYNRFKIRWNRIFDAFNKEYAPLENYQMEEVETPNITKDSTTKQNTDMLNESQNANEQQTHGFNSVNPVDTDSGSGSGSVHVTGDKDDNYTENIEHETGTRSLYRHGNIGVTSSQQMLQSEIDLRTKFDFIEQMYRDVDSVLCLELYA